MILTLEIALGLSLLLGLGVWGIVSGIRQSRRQPKVLLSPQQLSRLAQPYRGYMGEAVAIYRDVSSQARTAPKALQDELQRMANRLEQLISRAMPRAEHGTNLAAYLVELRPEEAQFEPTQKAAKDVADELADFVGHLKTLRGKVYQVLTDATNLSKDHYLEKDLEDALIEMEALETAFGDLKLEA